ncbi:hypothetical protein AaE_005236 [Aphanomyces astaci]|uniref:Uncharacterized protein n=1 Tax=Aphanomyces astaci TaxID=112090 RepID=A0A6A5ALL6_APHAT|nr:hypothetical protein AaE_005236 [Aphanomyces astaci]
MSAQRLFKTELNELQATMEHMCFEAFFDKVRYQRQRMMDAQGSITKANAFVLDVENWIFMQNVIEEYYPASQAQHAPNTSRLNGGGWRVYIKQQRIGVHRHGVGLFSRYYARP